MVSRDAVFAALKRVPEPCSIAMRAPTDIVAMGLVEAVQLDGEKVFVELVLTDPSCPHYTSMRRFISDALRRLEGIERVEVGISTTQLWTPDRAKA